MTGKVDIDSESPILVESDIVDESEPKVIEDSETKSEVEKPSIETLVDLPKELIRNLVPSLTAMRASLRSPNVYYPLQIFIHETGSQNINLLMVQSTVHSVFITDDSHMSATCD